MARLRSQVAIAVAGILGVATTSAVESPATLDPVLQPGALCGPPSPGGPPALLKHLVVAATETAPFQPVPPKPALEEKPTLFQGLGKLHEPIRTRSPMAQRWFDQGLLLSFGFNHAEAQRAFREAARLDPDCTMCAWGEALVLGPNINVPMMPEAVEPAFAASRKALALAANAPPRERALVQALAVRYSDDPKVERAALDKAYADAMRKVAQEFPRDDTVQALLAEALMDTQPWDYWEAGGARAKGSAAEIVATLERVLARNPQHPGAIHLYIHAMEASTQVEKALPHARRLAALAPGAGHLVHMPAHIYYRLGLYRESLEANRRAIAVDERYFRISPSDPLYKSAYYPHNIHFVMVSAQMGGDKQTALAAGAKLDAAIPVDVARQFAVLQPVKAAPYTTHAQFSDPAEILALPAPAEDLLLVQAMSHYARAIAHAMRKDRVAAQGEIAALAKIEEGGDFKPFGDWGVPAKEIVETARLVATARLADAMGDLDGAARAYEDAIFIEDSLAYMEPPFWYFPVRQSLGSVRLRQGRFAEAEKAFRDSLARVRNNGWALAGLAGTYQRMGDRKREAEVRGVMARAWFGPKAGPDLSRL